MILANYVVWTGKTTTIKVSQLKVGTKIAVLAEDLSIQYATVKSLIPVHATFSICQILSASTLCLAKDSAVLLTTGLNFPKRNDLIVCGSSEQRVAMVTENLTRKLFYDIMIDVDLPVIFQDGYCIKVKCKR